MPKNIVYFDLETQRSAGDVGGWANKAKMGMSVGVTYSTARGEYVIYSENMVDALVKELMTADLVVGFNVLSFDYEVLMAYTPMDLAYNTRTLDMLNDVATVVGSKLGLDTLAKASLGVGKTAEGMDAVRWWRDGKYLAVAEYCCYDVKATRLVHEYGLRHRQLHYFDRNQHRQSFEIEWSVQ